jgi:hypothetical protein
MPVYSVPGSSSNNTARAEAYALYRMLGDENTITELRELISVPSKIERVLRL